VKSEAIRCAIKLYSEPTLLARFSDPFRQLPRGITELLRLVSSDKALKKISALNHLHADLLKTILINYIQVVLLREENSDLRKLGLTHSADLSQCKLHYKLLMNIFHPDKAQHKTNPHYYTQFISRAYKNIKSNPQSFNFTKTSLPHRASTIQKQSNAQLNSNKTRSKLRNASSLIKKHLTKSILSLFLLTIFTTIFLLLNTSPPQFTVKKTAPIDSIPSNQTSKVIDTIDKTSTELLSSIKTP